MPHLTIQGDKLHKPADQIACSVIRTLRKNMLCARKVWLQQTAEINQAPEANSPQYEPNQHPDALHDFRVELRRLRVWLQQIRGGIKTKAKARAQLKSWAQASNANRDLEVMLDLLQQGNSEIKPSTLSKQLFNENKILMSLVVKQPLLLDPKARANRKKQPSSADWLASRIRIEFAKTIPLLKGDNETLHRSRIHIKHMRYLIEPIMFFGLNKTETALTQLKSMQTILGDLHDLFILRTKLPNLYCNVLNERLNERLFETSIPARGIQQDFTNTRNQLVHDLRWQANRYETAMDNWHSTSALTCANLEHALDELVLELKAV